MLLLLLAPMALVSAAPGSSKCTWGPSYWCANIPQVIISFLYFNHKKMGPRQHTPGHRKNFLISCINSIFLKASECSAVKHCIKAVWEKETVPQDDDEVEITSNKAPLVISK